MLKKVILFSAMLLVLGGVRMSAQSANEPKLAASADNKPAQPGNTQTKTGKLPVLSATSSNSSTDSKAKETKGKETPKLSQSSNSGATSTEQKK